MAKDLILCSASISQKSNYEVINKEVAEKEVDKKIDTNVSHAM